jgi:CelD/BcsL family acetyltransferase involved in cellulose biosynthesis
MAALAGVVDRQKQAFYALIIGRDTTYVKQSLGKVVFGDSIQYAIENGLREYDFVMGTEDYKRGLGARRGDSAVMVLIERKTLRSTTANRSLDLARRLRDPLRSMRQFGPSSLRSLG